MAKQWRGQTAILTVKQDTTDQPVGVLQDVEVSKESETSELYGSGSIKRQDVQQTEVSFSVSGTVSAWDMDTWETLIDYDTDGVADSPDIPKFTVSLDVTAVSSDTAETIQVDEVYFESVPISGSYDDYIELDLDGTGKDITMNPA